MARPDATPLLHEAKPLVKLATRIVEKPWGRCDVPSAFGGPGGKRIGEVWFEHPAGERAPLLVKYLFTSERLSIQVHPDDNSAAAYGFLRGKDECWLVLDAEPGAELGVGLVRDCSIEELNDAAQAGTIERLINWRPVKAGDFIYNPAGTIHAIGPGLTIIEVQQNVDATLRLYDYGRPRDLHVDAALAVAATVPHRDPRDQSVSDHGTVVLVDGPKFHLVRADGPINAYSYPQAELTVTPLTKGCAVGGEPVVFGECAVANGAPAIVLADQAQALIAWSL